MVSASEFLKWLNVFNVQTGSRPGTVSSVGTGTGLTGGTITTTGTISFAAIPAGTFWANITGGSAVPTTVTLASILAPYLPLAGGTMAGAINMGGFSLSNLPAPVASMDACTKQYADNIASGLNPVDAVVGASTANLTGWTYNNGTAGVGATLTAPAIGIFAPDGITLNVGDRWLYKDDTTGSGAYNGIYSVTVNNAGAQAVITRWSGYDTSTEIQKGDLTGVESGTINAKASYYLSSQPNVIGTDPLNYTAFFTPATYLQVINNLSDLNSTSTARTNLGVPSTTGTGASGTWNISILGNAATATSASSASSVPLSGVTGLGTGVSTALAINVGTAGAFVPTSGTGASGTWGISVSGNAATASAVAVGGITGLGTGVATALTANVTGTGGIVLGASPTITTPNIVGVTTANNAPAGSVGEFVSSTIAFASAISLSNNIAANVTSISLTAGDWDIKGNVFFSNTGTFTMFAAWSSTTSATKPDLSLISQFLLATGFGSSGISIPYQRISISATTTVYLSAVASFTTGTLTACGGIYARRVR